VIQLTPQVRLLLAVEKVDCRKGIDGLVAVCRQGLTADPLTCGQFVFSNRRRGAVKLLVYIGYGNSTGISSDLATPVPERSRSDLYPRQRAGAPKWTGFSAPDALPVGRRTYRGTVLPRRLARANQGVGDYPLIMVFG